MFGADWLFVRIELPLKERLISVTHIFYVLSYVKDFNLKFKVLLPLVLFILGIVFYRMKLFTKIGHCHIDKSFSDANWFPKFYLLSSYGIFNYHFFKLKQ